jgi:hypothetical protein
VTGWFELVDGPDGPRSWVVLGNAAYRWADGEALGALHVWAAVFASVLTRTLEVTADQAPEAARRLNFQGQGVALALVLFLARRTGVTVGDASDIIKDGAVGDPPTTRAQRAWNGWVHQFGDPARPLLRELAALRAVSLPAQDDGFMSLAPLAQWALREQLILEDIKISIISASKDLSPAELVELVDVVSEAEFNAEFEEWLSFRTPGRAARDLLAYAASADAAERLATISLVRRIGAAAGGAWVAAMDSPQLRGYAYIALSMMAADAPGQKSPVLRNQEPNGLDFVVSDLVSVFGSGDTVNSGHVAEKLAEAVPAGNEQWAFELLARESGPRAKRVLEVIGRSHPDRNVAGSARKSARAAARRPHLGDQTRMQVSDPGMTRRPSESRLESAQESSKIWSASNR